MKAKISSLQAELKIQKKHKKQRSKLESLVAAKEKLKSIFFSVNMHNRPCLKNLTKYSDSLKLHFVDKDVLILQRALQNEVLKWGP